MTHKEIGQKGESVVAAWMERHGYEILYRNFCIRGGEIDIIARKDGVLVFTEVKTRTGQVPGSGLEAITSGKRKLIIKTAVGFLSAHPEFSGEQMRFDVAELLEDGQGKMRLKYLENAFDTSNMNIFL